MQQKQYNLVVGTVFLIVALVHLLRALMGWEILIGGFIVPLWASWLAFVVAGTLSYLGFKLSKQA